MKRFQWLLALAAVCMLLAACGGTSSSSKSSGSSTNSAVVSATKVAGKLVVDNESGSTWTCQFNPFNAAVTLVSFGWVYEPLEYVNILKSGATTPWLATSSQWSNAFKTLTFTIRSGAKWSDGQPFSAADVAYTFNAMKSDKAIDLNALWKADGGPLTDVALKGNQVVLTFSGPSQPYFYLVADQTPIVPKHIWASLNQSKLHSYSDTHPVGTGPYLVSNCAPQNIKYLNNPNYWQSSSGHPVPAVKEVDYPAFLSNTAANLVLAQGGAQWGGQYIPNIQSFYISKDPANRHYWFAPVLNVSLFPNLTNPVLSQLPVRQAISLAIDRATVSRLGESGYQAPANQSGVVLPTYASWSDSSLAQTTYSPSKAEQTLTSAGFTKGSDGIYKDKSGTPLSFTIKTIAGYSDWDASLQLITQQLKAVGIKVTAQDENTTSYTTDLQSGHFELAYGGSGGPAPSPGPSPYYELRGLLFSGNIGSTNYERFKSPSTDTLFNQYSSASQDQQTAIIHQIQKVMVDQVPLIPVTEGVDWYQYDTSHFQGWPTQSNPYAQPSPYQAPDMGVVLTHLVPTG
ncbi:MAG TPA: ABC transporter substrate-binding protein [Solirubrobacteraceae bacterium]|nr:ABC transporter substrate-binding protein [Solirubrobacteraceae bacterium]